MNLSQLFDLSFNGRREEIGLEFQGRSWTFGEIDDRASRMAALLGERGIRAGDRLCVYLPNCLELIDLYLACIRTGVIFVPVNILYREREIGHILRDAEPRALVVSGAAPGEASSATAAGAAGISVWTVPELAQAARALEARRPDASLDGDTPAAIVYTSGTTGASKGAVLTHNNFAANALNLLTCWKITGADRFLLPLPLFHVHGLGNGLHTWLISGCRMRLLERFERDSAAAVFLNFRPTLFFAVPTIYVRLLETPAATAREIGGFMRLFVSGSAALPAHVLGEFHRLFGHTILERYGMSETMMNMSNPYEDERRPGSVGFPLPGISVRLLDAEGRSVGAGETGELFVRGPNVFSGYWRNEAATRAAFVDGYFRTGDLAVRSADGYYTLTGRKSDLIISGGFNIYPREIEEFLLEQAEVAEAAVVGVPDAARGEAPVAYIVLRDSSDAGALEARCRAKLASFKVPRAFVPVAQLPRTALGKVQKHLLPKWPPGS